MTRRNEFVVGLAQKHGVRSCNHTSGLSSLVGARCAPYRAQSIAVVRIYLREGEHPLTKIMDFLHNEEKVSGVTVLQGIMGFGPDGEIRTSHLLDLSLDLPLIIEFYDVPERVESVINHLQTHLGLSHVVSWSATSHTKDI
ncbi:MAG: DUF190 domain-containing protein [Methylobacter sp.]